MRRPPRLDCYFSIEFEEFGEGHIWATETEAEALERAMRKLLPKAHIYVEAGGEYDWIVDGNTDLKVLAREIIEAKGFVIDA